MKARKYIFPSSLAVDPLAHQKLKGDLILSFATGPLCGSTYRPLVLNSLWALIGALASPSETLSFDIKETMTTPGLMGGSKDGDFCLFRIESKSIQVLTRSPFDPYGASRITFE